MLRWGYAMVRMAVGRRSSGALRLPEVKPAHAGAQKKRAPSAKMMPALTQGLFAPPFAFSKASR